MRFLFAFVLALGLALVSSQTVSDTNSNSWTPSWTPSWTNSNSNSVSGSNTWTSSGTWTRSGTNSNSVTVTNSGTGTATTTYPQPPAPTGLINTCPNHIITACLAWTDPANYVFNYYRVYVQSTVAGSAVVVYTATQEGLEIQKLSPATTYNVWVAGVDTGVGVWSANSTVITVTTAAADPKKDPTRDVQNFACTQGVNPSTSRVAVTCTWTAAQDTVIHVNLKAHCVSATREPLLVRKKLWGSKATGTSAFFAINRDSATCNFYARFYYQRRPTTRHHVKLIVS